MLQAYILIIFQYIIDLGRLIRETYQDLADAEEMTVILNEPHEIVNAHKAKDLKVLEEKLNLKMLIFIIIILERSLRIFL